MFNDLEKDETITLNDLIADLEGHFGKRIESQVNALRLLREKLNLLKVSDDNSVAIVVKNGEIGPNTEHGYYILASISKHQATIFDIDLRTNTNPNRPLVFLFTNNVACVSHASSVAHKAISDLGVGVLELMPTTRIELENKISKDTNGIAQFVIGRDEQGNNITQNLESYILCALALGIDDRVIRFPVPEKYA